MNKICIQPLGDVPEEVLEFIRRGVEETFKLSCIVSNIKLNVPGKAFNSSRRQYYSSYILRYLLELSELMKFKRVLGVVDVDLYVPGLNFVFGEAILNGRASVISLFRLKPEFYGEIGGKNIYQWSSLPASTLLKEISSLQFPSHKKVIAERILKEICSRLKIMNELGLSYLDLKSKPFLA